MRDADTDAARRQAIGRISSALMLLTHAKEEDSIAAIKILLEDAHEDLTRARYLLVEHCDPDSILDELSKI